MKNYFVPFTASVILFFAFSCGSKKNDDSTADGDELMEWKEMDEFHMVMAETFHPYKDSADLAPVKSKVAQLVAAADQWVSSSLPKKVDNDEMKTSLQELKSETEVLEDIVHSGSDNAIGQQLTKVHDKFHHIQEHWYGDHDHH